MENTCYTFLAKKIIESFFHRRSASLWMSHRSCSETFQLKSKQYISTRHLYHHNFIIFQLIVKKFAINKYGNGLELFNQKNQRRLDSFRAFLIRIIVALKFTTRIPRKRKRRSFFFGKKHEKLATPHFG